MKTATFSMENLCVPCGCRCRHCLLSYDGTVPGAGYTRGKEIARRAAAESTVPFSYYIGFCMDTPDLLDYIAFCQEIGSPGGSFLQMNGLRIRTAEETESLVREIREAGIQQIDCTFYGLPPYHDRFAGRPGDFDFLLSILRAAETAGLPVKCSLPITEENAGQMEALLPQLEAYQPQEIRFFLPHSKGRGWYLEEQRLQASTLQKLPPWVQTHMPTVRTQTEAMWIAEGAFPAPTERYLTLSLTKENLQKYENMPSSEMLRELEELDDAFYGAIPPTSELAALYGDPYGEKLYRYRDLVLLWTKRFLRDHMPSHLDFTEERGHFSVRA